MLSKNLFCHKLLSFSRNTTLKNGTLFSFFSFLNSGINFLLLIIIAKFISPEGYGKLNIFSTTVMLLSFLIHLNTQGIISVNFFKESRKVLPRTINTVFLITIFCFLLYGGIIILYGNIINCSLNISTKILLTAIILFFFQVFSSVKLDLWRL